MGIDVVSVSVFNDSELLDECLHSIRDVLGDVPIQVVDGRYETHPGEHDNSTDATPGVAEDWGASYHPEGPLEREREKHVRRVQLAPAGERALFMDADERLLDVNAAQLDDETAYRPRIINPVVYSESPVVYWPRSFYPDSVAAINRWDAYLFDAACSKTDAITLLHRHDLRGRDYREAKYERIRAEGRDVRYSGDREADYYDNAFDVEASRCPRCGRDGLVTAPPTKQDGEYSRVKACIAGDGCYATVERVVVGEYRYVPEDVDRGFEEDPDRVRLELLDAGWDVARNCNPGAFAKLQPSAKRWVREEYGVVA